MLTVQKSFSHNKILDAFWALSPVRYAPAARKVSPGKPGALPVTSKTSNGGQVPGKPGKPGKPAAPGVISPFRLEVLTSPLELEEV